MGGYNSNTFCTYTLGAVLMGWKTEIPGDNQNCPCGQARFKRWSISDPDEDDGLHMHYDICLHCDFKVYTTCDCAERLKRFIFYMKGRLSPERSKRRCKYCMNSYFNNPAMALVRCTQKIGLVDRTCVKYERKWVLIWRPE